MSRRDHHAEVHHDARIDWMYPEIYEGRTPSRLTISLFSVRAANNLLIEYESQRDGWVIRMDRTREVEHGSETVEEAVEVAFIPAWLNVEEDDTPDRIEEGGD